MLAAFTYRDFRVQWFGACTSSVGTWVQITAQNWMVLSLTGSAFFLGLDSFLQQLPIMLFTLVGGVLADRRDRRRTLLSSQYLQMATAATLALLVYFDYVTITHILTAVVHHRHRAGVRRARLPVAGAVARRQEGSAERGRPELDPVQRRARHRPAALRGDALGRRHVGLRRSAVDGALLRPQRRLLPRRHLHADVAAREAHSAGAAEEHAGRAGGWPPVRPPAARAHRAHRPCGDDDVPGICRADLPAGLHQERVQGGANTYSHLLAFSGARVRRSARSSSPGSASSSEWV